MKKSLLFLALLPFTATAQIRGTVLNDLMNKSSVSVLEASAAMLIAQAVGMDPMAVIRETRPYGVYVYDTAPAWYIVHECHRPFVDVWRERRKGKGWGVIAKEMGMHPGTFNKMRKNGDFDHYCWVSWSKPYGMTDRDWSRYRGSGLNDHEIVIATAIGNGDHKRIESAVHSRLSSGSWDVPGRGKVKNSDAMGKGHGSSKGKVASGSGSSKGKGKGSGKSGGSGVGNGKSKGGGSGVGNGKSKGGSGAGNGGGKAKGGASSGKGKGKGGGAGTTASRGNGGGGKGRGKGH